MNAITQTIAEKRAELLAAIAKLQTQLSKLDQLEALANDVFPNGLMSLSDAGVFELKSGGATIAAVGEVTTKRQRVVQTTEEILSDGHARESKVLLAELSARGVEIGGKNPVNNLSAYLSSADGKFESNRKKGGWVLKGAKKPKAAASSKDMFSATGDEDRLAAV